MLKLKIASGYEEQGRLLSAKTHSGGGESVGVVVSPNKSVFILARAWRRGHVLFCRIPSVCGGYLHESHSI
jgi:hypothetical protein